MISPRHQHFKSPGAALIAVLWLIAILSMACMATLRIITFDLELASAKVHGSRARQVAEMGIAIGSNPVVKRSDPMLRQMNDESGEGFEVKINSEGGRFNINAILLQSDKELLKSMFIDWGLELEVAQEITDALIDWVDAGDDEQLNGAEKKYYEREGRINQPFNRPFYDLAEVSLVRGMDLVEAVRPDWRNWFTIWSGGPLDLNEAPAELIAAAAEISVEQADIIPETVRGAGNIARRFTVNDTTTRIESIGYAEGAKRKIAIIVRNRTGKPALLQRTEEIIP
jgi:type II secretory pathway component PulK